MNFITILCLVFIQFTGVPTLYAICFGIALSLPGLLPSYGVTALFPNNEYATTLGFSNCIFTIGSSFGTIIVLYLFLLRKAIRIKETPIISNS